MANTPIWISDFMSFGPSLLSHPRVFFFGWIPFLCLMIHSVFIGISQLFSRFYVRAFCLLFLLLRFLKLLKHLLICRCCVLEDSPALDWFLIVISISFIKLKMSLLKDICVYPDIVLVDRRLLKKIILLVLWMILNFLMGPLFFFIKIVINK